MNAARSLQDWLHWQSGLNPSAIDLGLDRVHAVWNALGAPSPAGVVVTVAGTNGKGSSIALLENILIEAGYRTGAYTSPHLIRYNERIRIDRCAVEDGPVCAAFARIEAVRGGRNLTYFEFGTLAALLIFAEAGLDVALLEVGLGGRLDAVNLVDSDVALITGIALDHQDWLGNDLESIAREKAGVMRSGRPVVYAAPAMPDAIRARAAELGSPLHRLGQDFRYARRAEGWQWTDGRVQRHALPLPAMRGNHQVQNAAAVLQVVALLQDRLPVDQSAIRAGLLGTRVPGRFEVFPGAVTWIYDVAHNPDAAHTLAALLGDQFVPGRTHIVIGMLADKDVKGVLRILQPRAAVWHLVDLDSADRGLSATALAQQLAEVDGAAVSRRYAGVEAALQGVCDELSAGDRVLVTGSFLVVGPALVERQGRTKPA